MSAKQKSRGGSAAGDPASTSGAAGAAVGSDIGAIIRASGTNGTSIGTRSVGGASISGAGVPPGRQRSRWRATDRGVIEFYNSDNLTFAASIAYYSLLSFFPFFLLVFCRSEQAGGGAGGDEQAVIDPGRRGAAEQLRVPQRAGRATCAGAAPAQRRRHALHALGVDGRVRRGDVAVNHAWGVEKPLQLLQAQADRLRSCSRPAVLLAVALFLVGAVEV